MSRFLSELDVSSVGSSVWKDQWFYWLGVIWKGYKLVFYCHWNRLQYHSVDRVSIYNGFGTTAKRIRLNFNPASIKSITRYHTSKQALMLLCNRCRLSFNFSLIKLSNKLNVLCKPLAIALKTRSNSWHRRSFESSNDLQVHGVSCLKQQGLLTPQL